MWTLWLCNRLGWVSVMDLMGVSLLFRAGQLSQFHHLPFYGCNFHIFSYWYVHACHTGTLWKCIFPALNIRDPREKELTAWVADGRVVRLEGPGTVQAGQVARKEGEVSQAWQWWDNSPHPGSLQDRDASCHPEWAGGRGWKLQELWLVGLASATQPASRQWWGRAVPSLAPH